FSMRLRLVILVLAAIIIGVGSYSGIVNVIKEPIENVIIGYKSPSAWNNRGVDYVIGKRVAQNDSEAVKWFCKAAKQGEVMAQRNLGLMYAAGKGVPQDNGKAMQWFRKAALQNDAVSQLNLGVMYQKGMGTQQNDREAIKWIHKAAAQGFP
ncbi:tetratricopeptide repeat protein, partial [Neisseria dumasiana]|uniref:tetratricopeptide repeat protein n=1 Tax=Neisseria dumasiana TaxID=1931275 RepID=UPI0031450F49